MSEHTVKVEARSITEVGKTKTVEGWPVEFVGGAQADIRYTKYTRDFSNRSARPFQIVKTGRRYKSLANALRAYGLLPLQ